MDGRLLALRENPVQANDVIETGLQRAGIQSEELEVAHSIAAVGCSQQRKQRLILIDGQSLTVAKRPTYGREIEAYKVIDPMYAWSIDLSPVCGLCEGLRLLTTG